jgi:hypothetical protein
MLPLVLRLADDSVRNALASVICAIRDALPHPPLIPSPFPVGKGKEKTPGRPIPLTPFPNGKGEQQQRVSHNDSKQGPEM